LTLSGLSFSSFLMRRAFFVCELSRDPCVPSDLLKRESTLATFGRVKSNVEYFRTCQASGSQQLDCIGHEVWVTAFIKTEFSLPVLIKKPHSDGLVCSPSAADG